MRDGVGEEVMFTAKGRGGVGRVQVVLTSLNVRVMSVHRTKISRRVMRSKVDFRRGTRVGTETMSQILIGSVILTSSSNLRVSCLSGTPKVCSTEFTKRSASCSVGGEVLLSELRKIPSSRHATEFIYTITTMFPSKAADMIHRAVRKRVKRRVINTGNFNCSPVFCIPRFKYAATRVAPRRGGGLDREKGTLQTVGVLLRRGLGRRRT